MSIFTQRKALRAQAAGMARSRARHAATCAGLVFWLLACLVRGDSWMPARESETLSENRRFVARVIPSDAKSKSKLVVSLVVGHQTNEIWRTFFSRFPVNVFVSDEGTGVVALDGYGSMGYGEHVVAIYGPEGLRGNYALEDFTLPLEPEYHPKGWITRLGGYEQLFSHSTSSRDWRQHSTQFFYRDSGETFFCINLDWRDGWVVWRISDGKLHTASSELASLLNIEGRRRALAQIEAGEALSASFGFLGRLRHPGDDTLMVEGWLRDTRFTNNNLMAFVPGKTIPYPKLLSYSKRRREADAVLSRWAGLAANPFRLEHSEPPRILGTVKTRVSISEPLKPGLGYMRLYLIPAAVPLATWHESQPEQYLIVDLSGYLPMVFGQSDWRIKVRQRKTVEMVVEGVTPGDYRVKVVWDKAPPFTDADTVVCIPRPGDYESVSSPIFTVEKGKETDIIEIDCKTLLKNVKGLK
jgi:hypothetical protein